MLKIFLLLSLFNWNLVGKAEKHLSKYYDTEVILSDEYPFNDGNIHRGDFILLISFT